MKSEERGIGEGNNGETCMLMYVCMMYFLILNHLDERGYYYYYWYYY